ncbi:T9SS type A sorting domain-containing protein [Ilyomonas limi]|uniref:T9SS type A sorting domain-containing protein n=1 Tax=Ilyomonas limi TaxID=2575867 RepID=A0A4U3KST5_9BACT|nr:T9SS type A sorting domain-containing protein [Ilyomonas limi]TKK65545.1 T9SS type A sorting domain-containing protein [Ilyomonas limi]
MKKTVLLFATALTATAALAQPNLRAQKTYGSSGTDLLYQMCFSKEEGMVVAGSSASGISGNKTVAAKGGLDFWIIKLGKTGNVKWERSIGGSADDRLTDIKPTTDSGYILAGWSISPASGDKTENPKGNGGDYWVVKVDKHGNIQWNKTIGGSEDDDAQAILQTGDGGYLVAGISMSGISGNKTGKNINGGPLLWNTYDIWLVKLDKDGNIQWDKTIGGTADEGMIYHIYTPQQGSNRRKLACRQAPDGGFVIATSSNSNKSANKTENSYGGSPDYWVLKTDAQGNVLWDKTIGGSGEDYVSALDIADDGSILVGGYSWSDPSGNKTQDHRNSDYWIVKLSGTGTLLWDKTIGSGSDDILQEIQHTSDGGFILAGNSTSGRAYDKSEPRLGENDYWIVKLNSNGAIEWNRTFGGTGNDVPYAVLEDQDEPNVYYIGGYSASPVSGNKTADAYGDPDYWVIKLMYHTATSESTNDITTSNKLSGNETANNTSFRIYPNPVTTVLHIQNSGKATYVLTNQAGKAVLTKTINGNGDINLANLTAGIYYLTNTATKTTQKVVITR